MPSRKVGRERFAFVAVLLGLVASTRFVIAQQRTAPSPIVGVWRIVEHTTGGPNGTTDTNPQPSIYIFTPRYYSITAETSSGPRPDLPPNPTDKQRADAFGPFTANAGTYDITGNELTYRRIVTKLPSGMRPPSSWTMTFRLEGNDTLWLTQPHAEVDGSPYPSTWKLTRLE
jgi:hypothetical protein